MSIESSALVWAHSQATGSALLALLAIADHDGDGGAWPSMETIAHRARVTRDAARKLIRRLEDMGEIRTDTNGGGGLRTANHMRTNRYEIMLVCPPSCDRSARHREVPKSVDGPVDNTPQPNGGGPAERRGAPQPNGGANHPLTTLDLGDDVPNPETAIASAREGFNPQAAVNRMAREVAAASQVKRPDLSRHERHTVPPAPKLPRLADLPATEAPRARTEAETRIAHAAAQLPCPNGNHLHPTHWLPGVMVECCNPGCGLTIPQLAEIVREAAA